MGINKQMNEETMKSIGDIAKELDELKAKCAEMRSILEVVDKCCCDEEEWDNIDGDQLGMQSQ
jgi:hypothetical protein